MGNLVVFYSRKGSTRKIGEMIINKENWDFEEIIDTKKERDL